MRPGDRSALREVSGCGTGLRPVRSRPSYPGVASAAPTCPCPLALGKPQAESPALTCPRCPFQVPGLSCSLIEELWQASFLSRSDCTEWSIYLPADSPFKKPYVINVCVCVCVSFLWVLSTMLWLCVKVYEMIQRLLDISQELPLGSKLNLHLFYD